MYQPVRPHLPKPPTKKVKIMAGMGPLTPAVLTIIIIVLCLQLITQIHKTNVQQKAATDLAQAVTSATDQLTIAKRQLIVQTLLPTYASFPAQCPGGNEKDGLFTPLSTTPI